MRDEDREHGVHDVNDGRIERAKDRALGEHRGPVDAAGMVGHAAGGVAGALTGAAVGSTVGPVGTVIGGIAGALGGWWTGRAIAEAAEALTEADETYYRRHYEATGAPAADGSYEHVRAAYHLGHLASRNPEYVGRSWEEIEPELRRGWSDEVARRHGAWDAVRQYAREGYQGGNGESVRRER